MKTNKLLVLTLTWLVVIITGCKKEEKLDPKSVFVDSTIPKNPLDNYIYNNFTKPYNISILYKYDDKESAMAYRLVPAPYDASIRLTKLLKHLVIDSYDEVTGSTIFIKKNFPKMITYTGSVPVETNGVLILGTAESGTKVSLYNLLELNESNGQNGSFLHNSFFKTIHHEFQHILNQNKPFPSNFKEISGLKYVDDDWLGVYPAAGAPKNHVAAGFISSYASKADTEDFAELFSYYVTRSQADFDLILNADGTTSAGKTIILSKLAVVKSYMKSEWGIDMDALRQIIMAKSANLSTFDQTTLN